MANLPAPGVSGISSTGVRTSLEPTPTRKKMAKSGQLKEGLGEQVQNPRNPPGTRTKKRNIVEVAIQNRRPIQAVFTSADGISYRYPIRHPETGADIPAIKTFALYLALRELALGGDPIVVLNAFGTQLPRDMDGNVPEMPTQSTFAMTGAPADNIAKALGESLMAESVAEVEGFNLGE